MVDARFFIDNSQVIGLWIIYAIVMWLGVCIVDLIFDSLKAKIKASQIKKARAEQRKKASNKQQREKTLQQIRLVMSEEI